MEQEHVEVMWFWMIQCLYFVNNISMAISSCFLSLFVLLIITLSPLWMINQ